MRLIFSLLLVLLAACSAPAQVPPRWIALDQGLGAHDPVLALAPTPVGVFAGAYDTTGVYRAGAQFGDWLPDNAALPSVPVFSLLYEGNRLWAGTANGLYSRGGEQQAWQNITAVPAVSVYSVVSEGDGVLFAGTDRQGAYESRDGGTNWNRLPGLDGSIVESLLAPDRHTLLAGTSGSGLVLSTDEGASWDSLPDFAGMYVPMLYAVQGHPPTLYASTRRALLRSSDRGRTWQAVGGGVEKETVYALLALPDGRILAGTAVHGLVVSRDAGRTWNAVLESKQLIPDSRAVLSLALAGNAILAGTVDGVAASMDGGRTWQPQSFRSLHGIGAPGIHDLMLDGQDGSLFLATDDGLYHAASRGRWERLGAGSLDMPVLSVARAPSDPARLYVGSLGRGVLKSEDGGKTWSGAGGELGGRTSVPELLVDMRTSQKVFARVLYQRIYKSTDGAGDWRAVWSGMNDETEVESMAIDPNDPGILYAGASDRLYRSRDGGESWQPRGLESLTVFEIWIDPQNSAHLRAGTTDGLYSSDDEGITWNRAGLSHISVTAITRTRSGHWYVGTKYNGIYEDGGTGYRPLGTGLDKTSIVALALDEPRGLIYAATSEGVYYLPL